MDGSHLPATVGESGATDKVQMFRSLLPYAPCGHDTATAMLGTIQEFDNAPIVRQVELLTKLHWLLVVDGLLEPYYAAPVEMQIIRRLEHMPGLPTTPPFQHFIYWRGAHVLSCRPDLQYYPGEAGRYVAAARFYGEALQPIPQAAAKDSHPWRTFFTWIFAMWLDRRVAR